MNHIGQHASKQLGQGNVVTPFLLNELKLTLRRHKKEYLSEMLGFLSGGLTVLICGMSQKLYKITVSKGDICKHAKSMLNVSGMFFIASRVS